MRLLIADPTDYSFPSGHTLSSVIGATILTKTDRRFGYAAIPLAALIAFSRLYLYVHFPSDVLAAAVLGRTHIKVCGRIDTDTVVLVHNYFVPARCLTEFG